MKRRGAPAAASRRPEGTYGTAGNLRDFRLCLGPTRILCGMPTGGVREPPRRRPVRWGERRTALRSAPKDFASVRSRGSGSLHPGLCARPRRDGGRASDSPRDNGPGRVVEAAAGACAHLGDPLGRGAAAAGRRAANAAEQKHALVREPEVRASVRPSRSAAPMSRRETVRTPGRPPGCRPSGPRTRGCDPVPDAPGSEKRQRQRRGRGAQREFHGRIRGDPPERLLRQNLVGHDALPGNPEGLGASQDVLTRRLRLGAGRGKTGHGRRRRTVARPRRFPPDGAHAPQDRAKSGSGQ